MKGAHRIIVETSKIKYDFVIKRNITILTGNSGSGKTLLIDYIREYRRYGIDSGVSVSCDCDCRTLDDENWERQLQEISDSIIFIDEGNRFLLSRRFAELVKTSDNYFVLATREKLPAIPYSINEIYGFRKSGKYAETKQKYNEIYHLYGEFSTEHDIDPKLVITEDSNSGYEFYKELSRQKSINCISANGKSNIIKKIQENLEYNKNILVIADGAALGSEIKDISEYMKVEDGIVLYAPESFEWMLLSLNIIPNVNVMSVLEHPEDYIESSEYVSWERFFTHLLIEKTKDNKIWVYSKKRLGKPYLSAKVISSAKKFMKYIDWNAN